VIALYPYDTLIGGLRLTVLKVTVDGNPLSSNYINPDIPEIAFRDLDTDTWEEAHVEVVVTAPAGELVGNPGWESPGAVLQVLCSHSNARLAVPLEQDPHTPARWTGTVELARDNWYGRAIMRALLPAKVDGVPHRVIGSSELWTLAFHDLPQSPVHGSIAVQWVNFAEDDELGLKAFKDDPQHLRLDPDAPSLYLNSGFTGLQPLLVDRRRRPRPEQALHDSTRVNIASDAWSAMFVNALDAVEVDETTGEPEWPAEEWRVVVLKTLFQKMYRDLGAEDALKEAVVARSSGEGSGELLERLLPAAARQVGVAPLLRRGIALLEKDAETKENDL
jgi:hypothetical protein